MDAQFLNVRRTLAACLFALLLLPLAAFCQPALPPNPILDDYSFNNTNWVSDFGYAPISETNLVSVPVWYGNALLLDTTNSAPAYLAYNIVETNGHTNLDFSAGAAVCLFICDWASADTNQNGAGPGSAGYLLAAGDFSSGSPDGLWAVSFDAAGTNISFGGVSNSTSTTFVSAPISWPTNSIHLLGLIYSPTNSVLWLDGQLAATGGPATIVPATNLWTNGFNIGSDSAGYEQARGIFCQLELGYTNFSTAFDESYFFTNRWQTVSNAYAGWQAGGGAGADFAGSSGSLFPGGGCSNCTNGTAVYMTNMSYPVVPGQGNTFKFSITGGTNGVYYDVFSSTNLDSPLSTVAWTWLGQGTNLGTYSVTNQPAIRANYVLGTPDPTNDGSGLTVAYERLMGTASDGYHTPNLWYLWQGLSPVIGGVPAGGDDPDHDGLLNYQEYLYGTNPQVSEGFSIWVAEPEQTSGIP
jgi:hypothetical protein